ncbi:MAG: hypothetical protein KAQ75_11865 [Bacteroidales bacterium]|nr:hypothetical protein [Bacteroidales bacterium]
MKKEKSEDRIQEASFEPVPKAFGMKPEARSSQLLALSRWLLDKQKTLTCPSGLTAEGSGWSIVNKNNLYESIQLRNNS